MNDSIIRIEGATADERRGKWEPVDFTTPRAWHVFIGRRIGATSVGVAVAASWSAFYIGVEVFRGAAKGVGVGFGPIWIGFAALRAHEVEND